MKFYTQSHKQYCGIDLHARNLYVCILDQSGKTLAHKNSKAHPDALLKLIMPYLDDLVIGVEGMFSWYWVADPGRKRKSPSAWGMHSTGGPFTAVKRRTTKSSGTILNSFRWPEGRAPGTGRIKDRCA